MRRITSTRLFAIALVLIGAAPACAQEAAPLEPISADAFAATKVFYEVPADVPLEARVVERKNLASGVREKFIFRGVRGFMVPGYLETPAAGAGPFPLVLLLHGWSGSKEDWWRQGGYISGGNVRNAVLAEGYAVLALDAPTHGDRSAENDYAMVNDLVEDGKPNHRNYFSVEDILIQTVRDYRRILDYVATRKDIDADRIGMLGYSMGGAQTFFLTAVEARIKVSVAVVSPSWTSVGIKPYDYAQGVGERPFLMLNGRQDGMCPVAHARQMLEFIPSSHKDLIFYEAGHKLPVAYVKDAVAWIKKYL